MKTSISTGRLLPAAALLLAVSVAACAETGAGNGAEPAAPQGDVRVLVTTATRSQDLDRRTVTFGERPNMSPSTITLDPATRYQVMDGFGAAVTGSTCYNLLQMTPENRATFLRETFSPADGMGHSYIRISIGCSDFSLSEYTCCDTEGIEHFALTSEENEYVIPVLREILAVNPDVRIMASPWTCPRWMKVNNLTDRQPFHSWTGGQLNPLYYDDYAAYFVKWIRAFAAQGIAIRSVTPQNEPLNRGNSASLFMGWREQLDFVNNHLVPHLQSAALDTKVYLFDHNYNYDNMADQLDYPLKIYDAGIDAATVAGAAYHNYGGNRDELLHIHRSYPDRELVFTETSIGAWNDGRNLENRLLEDMREVALGAVNNWCKAVIVWNLMLDTERGPNREGGCRTCYGAVDIDRNGYTAITRNSHYYIISHLAAVVKPGAVRIAAAGLADADITYAAFENPDGSRAAVLLNSAPQGRKITIDDGRRHFTHDVPPGSVVSYLWKQ
ncbi:MAG: glucosylceramidase [Tannerella sp.]|jgi:glucosylceramidase|nr:glucosylceramidase [Tannerella sp.]